MPTSTALPCSREGARWSSPTTTAPMPRPSTSTADGVEIAAIVDLRPDGEGDDVAEAREAGLNVLRGHAVVDTGGRRRVSRAWIARLDDDGSPVGPATAMPCDLIAMSGGWNPAAHLFSQSGGKLRYDEALRGFLPERSPQAVRCAGAVNGAVDTEDCIREGRDAGTGETATAVERPGRPGKGPLWLVPARSEGSGGKAFRRFPERRDLGRHRAGGARGLRIGRAPEALHDPRHGHRPGQDRERARARDPRGHPRRADPRGGHDHLPPALRAGHVRRHRRAGRGASRRPGAPDADSRMARRERRRLRGRGPVEAAVLLPAAGRGEGRRGGSGVPGGARRRRHHGREHARQDPGLRSRREGVPQPRLHQRLGPARSRGAAATG